MLQIYVVGNSSNQAYIGDEAGRTFSFALPPDAENVIFQGDLSKTRFVENESGYADTKPIIPGPEGQTIAISYDIPYNNEDNLTIETPLSAPVDSLNLLLEERGISLTSEQLEFVETRDIQGGTFSIFSGSQLKQGDTFTFQLSNLNTLPLAPPSEAGAAATTVAQSGVDQNLLRWLIIAGGGLAVIGAGIIYPLRRSQNTPQPATTAEHTRQKLLLLLARLDEMFEAGQLDEAVYRQTRAQYKAQLAAMMEDRGHL
jgi:hypothetical protein